VECEEWDTSPEKGRYKSNSNVTTEDVTSSVITMMHGSTHIKSNVTVYPHLKKLQRNDWGTTSGNCWQ